MFTAPKECAWLRKYQESTIKYICNKSNGQHVCTTINLDVLNEQTGYWCPELRNHKLTRILFEARLVVRALAGGERRSRLRKVHDYVLLMSDSKFPIFPAVGLFPYESQIRSGHAPISRENLQDIISLGNLLFLVAIALATNFCVWRVIF